MFMLLLVLVLVLELVLVLVLALTFWLQLLSLFPYPVSDTTSVFIVWSITGNWTVKKKTVLWICLTHRVFVKFLIWANHVYYFQYLLNLNFCNKDFWICQGCVIFSTISNPNPKKTPKNSFFLWPNIGITSLWEDLEAKLLTPGQLLGYPWKLWGITVQTSYVEGR